jgi:hypothetical protein
VLALFVCFSRKDALSFNLATGGPLWRLV